MAKTVKDSCCTGGCDCAIERKVVVEYLYLDLQTCQRCIGAGGILDQVMQALTPALELAGFTVEYNKVEMKTAEVAVQYQFSSSPTIRVNGQDICQTVEEDSCGCCSEISDTDVECRLFAYNGETFQIPPKEMLAKGILQIALGQSHGGCSCREYELPQNLKNFFAGKKTKSGCTCEGNCC